MNRDAFFASVRRAPFGSLSQSQVDGLNAILDEWDRRALPDIRWLAYMLATTFHETARTMQPIAEIGGKRARYAPFYGRGFVQLTWDYNYRKASTSVGVDLVKNPDRAMELPIATKILFDGMIEGWFTVKRLSDYINKGFCDYKDARKVINGLDRAVTIAGYAVQFERALTAAATLQPATHDTPIIDPGPTPVIVPILRPPPPDVPAPETAPPADSGGFLLALVAWLRSVFAPAK